MKADVLIESVKKPGHTKLVGPAFADILCILGTHRRVVTPPTPIAEAPPVSESAAPAPAKRTRKKRVYKTRDLQAEE
jgi:hypothetical protein